MKKTQFAHCHVSDGMMWCMFLNGKWAHPFPVPEQPQMLRNEESEIEIAPALTDAISKNS